MSIVLPRKAVEIVSQAADPRKAITDTIGDLSGIEIIGDMVLVGVYIRPEKTAGGIIRPNSNVMEDVWQGKVGLVLKCGPDAFVGSDGNLYEQRLEVGEWGVFKVGDAWQLSINEYPCRLVRDVNIRMKIANPSSIL